WAFRLEGFPALQILAFGDFSYQGRFARYNALLCRAISNIDLTLDTPNQTSNTFRPMTENDGRLREYFDSYSNVLSSCPLDSILEI
ncbi:hypothetical protein K469DRAFT_590996, partial [Zopfia rhizophila CBS 207.26]